MLPVVCDNWTEDKMADKRRHFLDLSDEDSDSDSITFDEDNGER